MKTIAYILILCLISTGIYAQSCNAGVGAAIINQTFGAGTANPGPALRTGITPLQYSSSTCPVDGQYTIANYSSGCFGGWITATDHTGNPNGYYMLINASIQSNVFYTDTIYNLCDGINYKFGAWVVNMVAFTSGYIEPNLTFVIKTLSGTVLQSNNTGNIHATGTAQWQQASFNFTTPPGNNAVILSITNNAPGGSGNDLALDDITFKPTGPGIDVGITGYQVDTVSFCGSIPALSLWGHVDSCYPSTDYQWQSSRDSGATWTDIPGATNLAYTPTISSSGAYLYRLLAASTGNVHSATCRVQSSVIAIYYNGGNTLNVSPRDTTVCPGSTVTYTASGGTNYQWSNNHQGATNTVTVSADSYYIVSASGAGCISTDTVHAHVYTTPQATIAQQNTGGRCSGDSVLLTASGGTAYIWNTGSTGSSIQVHPATTTSYTVKITDQHGCTASANISVQPPVAVTWNLMSTTTDPPCLGHDIGTIILSSTSNSSAWHYRWSNGDTVSNPDSLAAGVYTVTIYAGGTCDTTLSMTLSNVYTLQNSVSPPDTTVCPNSRVLYTSSGGGVSYIWSDQNQGAQDIVTVIAESIYIVTATDANGCQAIDTVHAHVYTVHQPVIIQTGTGGHCLRDSIVLSVSGESSYIWGTGSTDSIIHIYPGATTSYSVTTTDINGCPSTANDVINIAATPWDVNATTSDPVCPGINTGAIMLSTTDPDISNYIWSSGDTTDHLPALGPGIYSVVVSDSSGCDTTMNFTLSYSYNLQIEIYPQDTTVPRNVNVQLQTAVSADHGNVYLWSPTQDLSCTTCPAPIVHASDSAYAYTVYVTDANGCRDSATMYITTFDLGPLYVPNAFTPNGDGTNDYFQIFGKAVDRDYMPEFEVQIFDRWGELIYESHDPAFRWDGVYKGTIMPPGVYVYLIDYLLAGTEFSKHLKGSLTMIR